MAEGRPRRGEPHALRRVDLGRLRTSARRRSSGTACSARPRRRCAASSRPAGANKRAPAALGDRHRACTRSRTSTRTPTGSSSRPVTGDRRPGLVGAQDVRAHAHVVRRAEGRRATQLNVYIGESTGHKDRPHGAWNTDGNRSMVQGRQQGLARAARVRPTRTSTSYFATRQWVRAIRAALGDEALWQRALRYAEPPRRRARPRPQGRAEHRHDDRPLAGPGRAVRPVAVAERLRLAQRARRRPDRRAQRGQRRTSRTAAARTSAGPSRRCSRCSASRRRTATCFPITSSQAAPGARRSSSSCGSRR